MPQHENLLCYFQKLGSSITVSQTSLDLLDFFAPSRFEVVNILMCLWKCSQNIFTLDVSTVIKKFPPNVDLQIIERYLNSQHKCSRISFDISEADPGHHRERQPQMCGCQPIILSFSRKLHENEWSWAGRGARPKFIYVDDLSSIYSFSVHTCTLYQGPSNRGSLIILTQVTNNLVCRVQRLK